MPRTRPQCATLCIASKPFAAWILTALFLWLSIGGALAATEKTEGPKPKEPAKKAEPDLRRPNWGRVIGFMRDAATRQPLAGVTVSIQNESTFATEGKTVGTSDAAGRFQAEAPLGRRYSKLDLQRLLTSAWFSILIQPNSVTKQTRIIDVTQVNVRAEKAGYKPFLGTVRCARLDPGGYRVYLDDIFLAPEESRYASFAPDNLRHEVIESFTVTPAIAAPGEKVEVTLKARLPLERGGKYRAFLDSNSLSLVRPGTELVREKKKAEPGSASGKQEKPAPGGPETVTFTRTLTLPKKPKDNAAELYFFLLRDHDEVEVEGDWRALLQVTTGSGPGGGPTHSASESDRQAATLVDEGFQLVTAGDPSRAVEKFRAAIEAAPRYAPAHLYLGDTCLSLNRPDDAAAAYHQLVDLLPDDWEVARPRYARALIEGGRAELAARSLSTAEKEVKRVPYQVYLYRALSSASLGDFEAADADLTKAARRRRIPARVRDAITLKRAEAAVEKNPESPDVHLGLARVLADQKRWEEAALSIRRGLALDPEQAWAQMELGVVLRQLGREEESIAALEEAIRLDPNNVEARLELGETYCARQEYAKALPHYELVAERRATNFSARHRLALVYYQTGRMEEARAEFAQALRLARGKGDLEQGLQIPLGYTSIYFGPKKRLIAGFDNEAAAVSYVLLDSLETIKKNPDDGLAWLNIGSGLVRLQLPDAALEALTKAAALQPELIEVKYWTAMAQRALGRQEEARANLQAVVEANPLHPHAHLELAQILTEAGETEQAQVHVLTHARNWPHERRVVVQR